MEKKLRIGTRGSALALAQTKSVVELLKRADASLEIEIVIVKTAGDRASLKSVAALGATGVFTREIEKALLRGKIDVAVHSMKDLPTTLAEGLIVAAVPKRLNPLDALVSRNGEHLTALKARAKIGTGSARRRAQILAVRPDLDVKPIRGNVETRIRRVNDGELDGVILAMAGLTRLGLTVQVSEILTYEVMLPAAGQGALAVEVRRGDAAEEIVRAINHADSFNEVTAERSLLRAIGAGCIAPVGALARATGEGLALKAAVLDADGKRRCEVETSGAATEAEEIGKRAAALLMKQGAADLIKASRMGK
jgi:hydroxymethylbilane synthase